MASWNNITQKKPDRIKNGITRLLGVRQLRLRQLQLHKIKIENSKPKHKIYEGELIAIIASMIIIIIAYGGLGLVLNVLS
jgi:hypothetical protein